uniref:Uncharacterized protein n=1 Tax=Polysiphonia urceolata TaxID=173545 RepID=A0A1Z1MBG5_POLUR|nr:hypothetical protein [Polysiphonia stricta]ARW63428.1 hypothetical protein [Polysiphonia stricta]
MSDTNLLFRLYLLMVFFFLLFFSLFLSKEMYLLLKQSLQIISVPFKFDSKKNLLNDDYFTLFNIFFARGNFLICLSLSEFYLESDKSFLNKDILYTFLAYVYCENSFWNIAEYYYLKALSLSPENCDIMFSLGKMYDNLGHKDKLRSIVKSISLSDPNYDISSFSFK